MKKNKKQRALALALSSAMILSLAVPVMAEGDGEAAKEPITLTWGIGAASCPLGDGVHTDDSAALKAIEEKLGITIEWVTWDQQKFDVLAAGGDLPDIVSLWPDIPVVNSLMSSEQIIPLDDLLEEYGQNIAQNIPDCLAQVKGLYGKTYYLPVQVSEARTTPSSAGFMNFRARYDIYKAIGSPEIHTEDDFLDVLKQMQDYQREQTGENDIYALSAWADGGTWPYIVTYPFAQGLTNMSVDNYACNIETGEIQSNFMEEDSAFWNGLRFFNKAYNLGIFDPDGFTQKGSQYYDKMSNGKLLCSGADVSLNRDVVGQDATMVRLPGEYFPAISGVYGSLTPFGYQMSSARAISANCEYPERAMELLNYLDTTEGARTIIDGVQGEDWDYIDGVPQFIGDMLEAYKNNTAYDYRMSRTAQGVAGWALNSNQIITDDGYPVDLSSTAEFMAEFANPADKAFANDFGCEYPGEVYAKWVDEGTVTTETTGEGLKMTGFMGALSDEALQINAEATDYFLSNVTSLITAEDDDAFNAEQASMIEKFKEIGYEDVQKEVEANYEESLAKYHEIYGE